MILILLFLSSFLCHQIKSTNENALINQKIKDLQQTSDKLYKLTLNPPCERCDKNKWKKIQSSLLKRIKQFKCCNEDAPKDFPKKVEDLPVIKEVKKVKNVQKVKSVKNLKNLKNIKYDDEDLSDYSSEISEILPATKTKRKIQMKKIPRKKNQSKPKKTTTRKNRSKTKKSENKTKTIPNYVCVTSIMKMSANPIKVTKTKEAPKFFCMTSMIPISKTNTTTNNMRTNTPHAVVNLNME